MYFATDGTVDEEVEEPVEGGGLPQLESANKPTKSTAASWVRVILHNLEWWRRIGFPSNGLAFHFLRPFLRPYRMSFWAKPCRPERLKAGLLAAMQLVPLGPRR